MSGDIHDDLIQQFEVAWSTEVPQIEAYLPSANDSAFEGTLKELVIIDMEFRWKRTSTGKQPAGEPLLLDAYLERFPQLKAEPALSELAEEEFVIRRKYGDRPDVTHYQGVYPEMRTRLRELGEEHELPTPDPISTSPPHHSNALPQIAHYKVLKEIGEGGMGSVYLAKQEEPIRRYVALKLIRSGLDSKEVIARFEAERQALAIMEHPNIARIYEGGTTATGQPFFAMEYVDGIPLNRYCEQYRLTVRERLELFLEICSAIAHAHQKGILHRDLKPSNVLVMHEAGHHIPKVIDFGLAKALDSQDVLTDATVHTRAGQVLGTLKYMSPEQASTTKHDIDTRTDVYALGIMLYELLTGQTPLERNDLNDRGMLSVLEMIRDLEPKRPSVRLLEQDTNSDSISAERRISIGSLHQMLQGDLDWVVMKAIEKERERRYESVSEFAADISRFLSDEPVSARPPSTSYRLQKFAKKNRVLVVSGVLMLLLLITGVGATVWQAVRATNAERAAKVQESIAIEKADEAKRRQKEAEEARDNAKAAAHRAESVLELFVDSFDSANPAATGVASQSALDVLIAAETKLDERLKEDPQSRVKLLTALAESYRGLGDYVRSENAAQKAVETSELYLDPDALDADKANLALMWAWGHLNKIDEAIQLGNQRIARLKKQQDSLDKQLQLVALQHITGVCLDHVARHDEAIPMLQESFDKRVELLGKSDTRTVSSMSALGSAMSAAGRLDAGTKLLEEAQQVVQEHFDEADYIRYVVWRHLALSYQRQKKYEKAGTILEALYRRAKESLGLNHPDSYAIGRNLREVYLEDGRTYEVINLQKHISDNLKSYSYWEAAAYEYEYLLTLQIQTFGENHHETIATLGKLAECYYAQSMYDKAIELGERNIAGCIKIHGKDALQTQLARSYLAYACEASNRPERAVELLEAYIENAELQNEATRFEVLQVVDRLIPDLLWIKDGTRSKRYLTYRLELTPVTNMQSRFEFNRTMADMASSSIESDLYSLAMGQIAIVLFSSKINPEDLARCKIMYALCQAELNTLNEATEKEAVDSYDRLVELTPGLPVNRQWYAQRACERLIQAYETDERAADAEHWKEQLAALITEKTGKSPPSAPE